MNHTIRMPFGHTSRVDPDSGNDLPQVGKNSERIPRTIRTRLILSVNGVFIITMVLFLSAAYFAETRVHQDETYTHLAETAGMIAFMAPDSANWTPSSISGLESKLSWSDNVQHRILFTDSRSKITGASDTGLIGQEAEAILGLSSGAFENATQTQGTYAGIDWLISNALLDPGTEHSPRVVVMRKRSGSEQFVRGFFILHGIHIVVTMLAFVTLLHLIGTRYLIHPIKSLSQHIERIESGDFRSAAMSERRDEFGWLARRFAAMGRALSLMVTRQIRAEKYASVAVLSFRFVRELSAPLHSLERHIVYLEGLGTTHTDIKRIAHDLRRDKLSITKMMRRLNEIQPPPTDFEL